MHDRKALYTFVLQEYFIQNYVRAEWVDFNLAFQIHSSRRAKLWYSPIDKKEVYVKEKH